MQNSGRRLSIVVPCYRVGAYLDACLDSILAESGDDIEVIAVDDASPDDSPAILDKYAAADPRVRVVHLPVNSGLGPARNAGLARASGDYVWFVDADDWLPSGSVRAVLDRLDTTNPDVLIVDHAEVFPNAQVPRRASDVVGTLPGSVRLAERPQLLRLAQSACTKIVRRTFLDEVALRFPPGWYEDAFFGRAVLLAADSINLLGRVGYCYRQQTPGSITSSASERHFEVFDQYARLFDWLDGREASADSLRPELFRLMIDHYLVILGHPARLPAGSRRAFFRRIVEDYTRRMPAEGYAVPSGMPGLKHRLVAAGAYPAYAALRLAYRASGAARFRSREAA